ncbi:MAG TPA: acetate--CoA ligase family protein [Streptosporangiaceae bacterium]|nr:acetate--CoA ligase family protein [Streptosporangiaceae bacterium]
MTRETPAAASRMAATSPTSPTAADLAGPGQQERDPRSPLLLGPDHDPGTYRPALLAMLEARSVALVGASSRPGSLGERMVAEVSRSPAAPRIHLVNPRYQRVAGRPCHPSLADLPETVDLVLLGVPDSALAEQLSLAARRGDRSAVIFGGAYEVTAGTAGLRARLTDTARAAGMAVCGAGCMGFVNVAHGLRAVGYMEPESLPAGPVAFITHSGSVFSAMLRSRRQFGFTLAVSSGQELVTPAAAYARYALSLPQTRVLALVLEAIRDPGSLQQVLAAASAADIPVVLLTAGSSAAGQAMVTAHSGALAGQDGSWEALADAYGVHRVSDFAEMADTLELFAIGRRAAPAAAAGPGAATGIAAVHDSGLERAHTADLADELGVPFAAISDATKQRLAGVLDPGLEPANPLDMWNGSRDAEQQLTESLTALADDPAVAAVALAVDLLTEFDGDRSYPLAVNAAALRTAKPLVVLANVAAAVDPEAATWLRQAGIPVLESARSGLLALRHLLDHAARPAGPARADPPRIDTARRDHWARVLAQGEPDAPVLLDLLRAYGIRAARTCPAGSADGALAAAAEIGYPVVLKTGQSGIAHKSDAGGVVLGIREPAGLAAAYADMAGRLGPRVLVCETAGPGTELALGITRDPDLGPLVVIGAGGVLVEFLADRAVALPPVDAAQARRMLGRVRVARLLAGVRGQPAADTGAVAEAVIAVSAIARELGDQLEALDINPLICGPAGAVAVDALAVRRR